MFLDALEERFGAADARRVFADLRAANDVESPVSVPGSFPQQSPSATPEGSVVLDDGSFSGAPLAAPAFGSNALLVGAKRSETGRPLFVAGPQVGYFFPEFFAEMELAGAGFAVRGAVFPGVPLALIGRGPDFAWSATSSQADNLDLFVETLCDDDTHYLYRGQCEPMRRFFAGTLKAQGQPDQEISYYETTHGPVVGYATVSGKRVAISVQRSTRGRELLSTRAFYDLNTGRVDSAKDFLQTMNGVEFSFNWFYADDRDIALFSSGRLPIRAAATDPALPTVGNGDYDWRGFVPLCGPRAGHQPAVGRDPELEQPARRERRCGGLELRVRVGAPKRPSPHRGGGAEEALSGHARGSHEQGRDPGSAGRSRLAGHPRRAPDRPCAERTGRGGSGPPRQLARGRIEQARPRARREGRRSGRRSDGRRVAAAGRCRHGHVARTARRSARCGARAE